MKLYKILPLALLTSLLAACNDRVPSSNKGATLEYFQQYANSDMTINSHIVRELMDSLIRNDDGQTVADLYAKRYYRNQGGFLWIDRHGVDQRADTLLSYLQRIPEMGFNARHFYVSQIATDLDRLRDLRLEQGRGDINHVLARLEYRLTKSFLTYAGGQRFGYVNPTFVLNRLDSITPNPYDSVKRPVRYRGLFDVKMQHVDGRFFDLAMQQVREDKLAAFLQDVQPRSAFYKMLVEKLNSGKLDKATRAKILVNMERFRWRQDDSPEKHKKYVLVNIPSFHLLAIDHADTLSMRIGCGAPETKTPLLNSNIMRMDLNPQWFMPRSIVTKSVLHHAGSTGYFASHNYYIMNRSTGQEVNPAHVTRDMLLSGGYAVVQRGGKGNALGRIIFRFDNNFSVYLHDTSSRGVFGREDRGVSHGCVRVEKPFELAKFLLPEKDERTLSRIHYSMTADSLSDKSMVIGSKKLVPQVPLFITYYTLYPLASGMANYPDVYGYDRVIFTQLQKYL